ncbi:MAG: Hpt domain-containing protein, partial [Acidimicrobiia bacterium]
MDPHSPELTEIFRQELEERSRRLVEGARALSERSVDPASIPDLVRDAHTIKGSAGMLDYPAIAAAAARLEKVWRRVAEGQLPDPEVVVAMEATAGRLLATMDNEDPELAGLVDRLDASLASEGSPAQPSELLPVKEPE